MGLSAANDFCFEKLLSLLGIYLLSFEDDTLMGEILKIDVSLYMI